MIPVESGSIEKNDVYCPENRIEPMP